MHGQRAVYNENRPEGHDLLRSWRAIADSYEPKRILVGETYVLEPDALANYYGDDDELNLAFNFSLLHSPFEAAALRQSVEEAEQRLPAFAQPVWTGGNHDNHRFASRWCGGDPQKIRLATLMLLSLRGTPFLYYGDEIGMLDAHIADDQVLDPVGKMHGARVGRDPERSPMQWTGEPGAGFSPEGVVTWLPYGDYIACNVADQQDDPRSMLALTRDLVAVRKESDDLRRGAYRTLPASDD
jgi:alpha-glucosidase